MRREFPRAIVALHLLALALVASACTGVPDGITPVDDLDVERYLGTWYELARYDHRFERGLEQVSATYALIGETPGDGLSVLNRGFDTEEGEWSEATGRAFPLGAPNVGHLEVSFFGPFYGSYVIFALDPDYRWAWVTGYDRSFLWLLSRDRVVDDAQFEELLPIARGAGFDTDALIRVKQD